MGLGWRINNAVTRVLPFKHVRSRAGRPMASITFDDFPKSAWTVAGPILAEHDVKATYYVAGRFCGLTEDGITYFDDDDLAGAHNAGHEIACHSFAHDKAPSLASHAFLAEADRNAAFVAERLGSVGLAGYAYPYGEVSPRTKALAARRYGAARGIARGVNAGWIDLAQLKAIAIEHRRWRPDEIDAAIARAKRQDGWLIFFTHDVDDGPSPFGCTPAMLRHVLQRLIAEGIETLPVKHAMARAVFGGAA
jgi:peptidoglycan/xylan/chitin deacetylase (PgdA/CDA1 family)